MPELINASTRGAKKSRGNATLKLWGKRALIALVAGASLGAGAGVLTVNRLEPGRGTGVDSLAVMLDSIARGRVPAGGTEGAEARSAADSAASAAPAAPAELVAVPTLEGLEEGAARNALLDAGLSVGEIEFQASPKPAGTVLASVPIAGAKLAPETPVTLVLSDGRPADPDTLVYDPLPIVEPDSLVRGRPVDPDTLHFLHTLYLP